MRVFGLTGGIATGKSSVAHLLRLRGVPVVDADVSARAVVEPGSPTLDKIADEFGTSVLDADGRLDRAVMRALIASDPSARTQLQAITHPPIFAHIQQQLAKLKGDGHPIAVVEAALMVETGSYTHYDTVIVVTCSPEQQLARALARDGSSEETIRGLLAAQMPIAAKVAVADVVIENEGSRRQLAQEVDRVWTQLTS